MSNLEQDLDFIRRLKRMPGAVSYDGDASVQVAFLLANGKTLRIGLTDEDVGTGELWADNYAGLHLKGTQGGDLLHALRQKKGPSMDNQGT